MWGGCRRAAASRAAELNGCGLQCLLGFYMRSVAAADGGRAIAAMHTHPYPPGRFLQRKGHNSRVACMHALVRCLHSLPTCGGDDGGVIPLSPGDNGGVIPLSTGEGAATGVKTWSPGAMGGQQRGCFSVCRFCEVCLGAAAQSPEKVMMVGLHRALSCS